MPDAATQSPSAVADPLPATLVATESASAVTAQEVVATLQGQLRSDPSCWKRAMLEAIGAWPLATETWEGERRDYLIAGEAFDWRLLASRLARGCDGAIAPDALAGWLSDSDPVGGVEEAEFTRLLGVDKYRSHLSYVYGVSVERALVTAVEEEITKRRVASGHEPSEKAREEAFERLYDGRPDVLWAEFYVEGRDEQRGRHGPGRKQASLGDLDAFTYWLFKRRMKRLDPARVASDTRKGLVQLERMRRAHERRLREARSAAAIEAETGLRATATVNGPRRSAVNGRRRTA